jgi:hypothetical protein
MATRGALGAVKRCAKRDDLVRVEVTNVGYRASRTNDCIDRVHSRPRSNANDTTDYCVRDFWKQSAQLLSDMCGNFGDIVVTDDTLDQFTIAETRNYDSTRFVQ